MVLDPIVYCLEIITDYTAFERLCNDLMVLEDYPDLEPLGGFADQGRDAIHQARKDGRLTIFAYSVEKDWEGKLNRDCKRIHEYGHTTDSIVFITTGRVSTTKREKAKSRIKDDYRWDLRIFGLEKLRLLLRIKHPNVIDLHPGLFSMQLAKAQQTFPMPYGLQIGDYRNVDSPKQRIASYGVSSQAPRPGFEQMLMETATELPTLIKQYQLPARLSELIKLIATSDERESLFWFIATLDSSIMGSMDSIVQEILQSVMDGDDALGKYNDAITAVKEEQPSQVLELLGDCSIESNPMLLQLRGQAYIQLDQASDALRDLEHAASLLHNPELHQRVADLAYSVGAMDIALEQTKHIVEMHPDDIQAHRNLASLYFSQLIDNEKAAQEFAIIHAAEPEDQAVSLSLANILVTLNRPEEGLAVFNEICALPEPPKPAVLGRTQLLEGLYRLEEAFTSLIDFKDRFQDDPDFLLVLSSIAFAAGKEEEAHSALFRLEHMRQEGVALDGKFERVTGDDCLSFFRDRFKQVKERDKVLLDGALRGRIPWAMADRLAGIPPIQGWMSRTQPRERIPAKPSEHAGLVLYATNALQISRTTSGEALLTPLKAGGTYDSIVFDITSIITLWKLELLDSVANNYRQILVPEEYLASVHDDSRQMILHQRSRVDALQRMDALLSRRQLLIESGNTLPLVDEYVTSDQHVYRLVDLVLPMFSAGVVTDRQFELLDRGSFKDSSVDEEHPPIERAQSIQISLTTLEVLFSLGLMRAATGFFRLHVQEETALAIRIGLDAISRLEDAQAWHLDLWAFLRDDPRFTFVPHTVPEDMKREDDGPTDYTAFVGYFVSDESGIPLLVDDRVIQTLALNEHSNGETDIVFGTGQLLLKLVEDEKLDPARAADAILQLMRWRYRFLLPDATILITLACRYLAHPPGQALREVALYVHDCMRDPGLSTVPEKTDIGEPMAMRLYLSWVSVIADFMIELWGSSTYPIDAVRKLTTWSMQELLPSTPAVLNGEGRRRLGDLTARALLSHVLIKASTTKEPERLVEMMSALQEGLRLTDEEYNTLITKILDGHGRTRL